MKGENKGMDGERNQSDLQEGDPHSSIGDGTHIVMPSAGVKHGEEVHYDTVTSSDANNKGG